MMVGEGRARERGGVGMVVSGQRRTRRNDRSGRWLSHAVLASFAVLLPLVLAACSVPAAPPLRQGTADFSGGELAVHYNRDEYLYNGGVFCPFYGKATRRFPTPNRLLVGYENVFLPGTDPFPCITKIDLSYRGGVRFDLSTLTAYKRIVIEKATLRWTIESAVVKDGSGNPRGIPGGTNATNCVGAVLESKGSIFTEGAYLPGYSLRVGQGDVTSLVTSWVVDKQRNDGFVLVGRDESYQRDNSACLNTIRDVSLHIRFLAP